MKLQTANLDWIPHPAYPRTLELLLFVLQSPLNHTRGVHPLVRILLFPLREVQVSFQDLPTTPLLVQASCHPIRTTVEFPSTGVVLRLNNRCIRLTPALNRNRTSHKVVSPLPGHLLSHLSDMTSVILHQFDPLVLNILNTKTLIIRPYPPSLDNIPMV
jgi:hypothetical protein